MTRLLRLGMTRAGDLSVRCGLQIVTRVKITWYQTHVRNLTNVYQHWWITVDWWVWWFRYSVNILGGVWFAGLSLVFWSFSWVAGLFVLFGLFLDTCRNLNWSRVGFGELSTFFSRWDALSLEAVGCSCYQPVSHHSVVLSLSSNKTIGKATTALWDGLATTLQCKQKILRWESLTETEVALQTNGAKQTKNNEVPRKMWQQSNVQGVFSSLVPP